MPGPVRQIEPEFYERLGRIVTRWSLVESYLDEFLAFLLRADPGLSYVVTQNVSGSTVVGWIRTLISVSQTDQQIIDDVTDLLNRIDIVRAGRNALAHGIWHTHADKPDIAIVQTVRWERSEIVKDEVVTLADLHDLFNDIGEIVRDLKTFGASLGFLKISP